MTVTSRDLSRLPSVKEVARRSEREAADPWAERYKAKRDRRNSEPPTPPPPVVSVSPSGGALGVGDAKVRALVDHLIQLDNTLKREKSKTGVFRETFEVPLPLHQELRDISESYGFSARLIIVDALQEWCKQFRQILTGGTNSQ